MSNLPVRLSLLALTAYVINDFAQHLRAGMKRRPRHHMIREEKKLRDNLSERQIDKSINDSLPASDPATFY